MKAKTIFMGAAAGLIPILLSCLTMHSGEYDMIGIFIGVIPIYYLLKYGGRSFVKYIIALIVFIITAVLFGAYNVYDLLHENFHIGGPAANFGGLYARQAVFSIYDLIGLLTVISAIIIDIIKSKKSSGK